MAAHAIGIGRRDGGDWRAGAAAALGGPALARVGIGHAWRLFGRRTVGRRAGRGSNGSAGHGPRHPQATVSDGHVARPIAHLGPYFNRRAGRLRPEGGRTGHAARARLLPRAIDGDGSPVVVARMIGERERFDIEILILHAPAQPHFIGRANFGGQRKHWLARIDGHTQLGHGFGNLLGRRAAWHRARGEPVGAVARGAKVKAAAGPARLFDNAPSFGPRSSET